MAVAAEKELSETCADAVWSTRLWSPARCKPRAVYSSLLRRALLNLPPALVTALHGWPQLIHSGIPCCREL